MAFFFPNTTTCKICSCPIGNRKDAILAPEVNLVEFPQFVKQFNGYFHRSCFELWDAREEFSLAAMKSQNDEAINSKGFSTEKLLGLILSENKLKFFDFKNLFILSISKVEFVKLLNFLTDNQERLIKETNKFETIGLRIEVKNGQVHLIQRQGEIIVLDMILSGERLDDWIGFLESYKINF